MTRKHDHSQEPPSTTPPVPRETVPGEDSAASSPLVALQAEVEELRGRHLRALADFDNFRKRSAREREEIVCYANEKLIGDLLPVIDNLERALVTAKTSGDLEGIRQGVSLIGRQLRDTLGRCGLEAIPSLGRTFDPTIHEAVGVLPGGEHEEGKVVEELQKGYTLKGKVLRPSMVRVGGGGGSPSREGGPREDETSPAAPPPKGR